jgi:antitoxin VapB
MSGWQAPLSFTNQFYKPGPGLSIRYDDDLYSGRGLLLSKTGVARLFRNGRSQAVRLPKEFRFEGDRVRLRRVPRGILLEPLISDPGRWFQELDRFAEQPFMSDGRRQPVTPRREVFK